jgi:hypothetical protein
MEDILKYRCDGSPELASRERAKICCAADRRQRDGREEMTRDVERTGEHNDGRTARDRNQLHHHELGARAPRHRRSAAQSVGLLAHRAACAARDRSWRGMAYRRGDALEARRLSAIADDARTRVTASAF